jgi:outer membrane protein OmpA-like peptidoglycan-associated protein
MERRTVGALLLGGLLTAAAGGGYVMLPIIQSSQQVSTSDAARAKGTITVGMDNFIGYFGLCSEHMRQLMLADGYKLDCRDDKADYAKRFEMLREGKINLAVATVDTYVLGGQRTNYPGAIVAVVDKSKGGDAALASEKAVKDLTDFKSRLDLKVAFTPDSPSDHLRKAMGVEFDIPLLRSREKSWRIETKGSEEAREKLLSGEAQVAIMWEPDVSKALARPGIVKLLGSEASPNLIVDVLLANRDYNDRYPDRVRLVLANYFKTLKYYRDNPERLRSDAASYAGVSGAVAEQMLKGVEWATLADNADLWLGIAGPGQTPVYGLFEAIERTVRILKEFGDVTESPLPGGDPRRIINSAAVATLATEGLQFPSASKAAGQRQADSLAAYFAPLDEAGWRALREVGTLKVQPILFPSGSDVLSLEDKKELDRTAETLKGYPLFRVQVEGHTKPGGDKEADRQLSQERAEAVARYLEVTYAMSPSRLRSVGFGASKPLPRASGEAERAYRYRLSRVEIHLKQEAY